MSWVVSRCRGLRAGAVAAGFTLLLVLPTLPAQAFEAVNGRVQAHGYFEMQMRVISKNFGDQWDMTQWYNIFNLELELDLVQETHGPLDLLSAFIRIEARFDCVYSRGCGMVRGVDVYGNRARRLPNRLQGGDEFTNAGSIFIQRDGPWAVTPERNPYRVEEVPLFRGIFDATPEGLGNLDRTVLMQCAGGTQGTGGGAFCVESDDAFDPGRVQPRFWQADRNKRIAGVDGSPIDDGTAGAPYLVAMNNFRDFEFTAIPIIGGDNFGNPLLLMGPWLPKNFVQPNAALANLPNPLDFSRVSPQSLSNGIGANPMRPIPIMREDDAGRDLIWLVQSSELNGTPIAGPTGRWEQINPTAGRFSDVRWANDRAALPWEARGAFTPTAPLRRGIQEGKFENYPFNFTEQQRAFNRGASQQDEGELKEAYLDIEMFDSRLWMRIGKQSIVWGKTELFRTTDQFNPQDFALATLPSLEESRINLWAARGVWSFYEVGPLSDVRLELAMNFDEFESADLGACGEPYAINLVCGITFGSFAHGITGIGVAGFARPPNPWESTRGIEFGGRLEWRWDRYSFALTNFYGYDDFPHPVRLATYNRNVDWRTGRPRHYMDTQAQLADPAFSCAALQGRGVEFPVNPLTGGPDLTQEPIGPATRVSFDRLDEGGCLTPGPSNRQVRVLEEIPGNGVWYGVPYRVSSNVGNNPLLGYSGQFLNTTSRADQGDIRFEHSRPTVAVPTSANDWLPGPNAGQGCAADGRYNSNVPGQPIVECATEGRRTFDPRRTINVPQFDGAGNPILVGGQQQILTLENPGYNPFYDPRMDPFFDVSDAVSGVGGPTGAQVFRPGDVIAASPVLFDPFQVYDLNSNNGHRRWGNAYNPQLNYDERNSLDLTPVNGTLFNWVCATTVGFNDLDPSACALTVFSSPKPPGGSQSAAPRIASVISAFLVGDPLFNGFLGKFPTDDLISKGSLLPDGMGIPLVRLHTDLGVRAPANPASTSAPLIGLGLDAFRTVDARRHWADLTAGLPAQNDQAYPWIYSRETESYNCLPEQFLVPGGTAPVLCGGITINTARPGLDFRYRAETFLSAALSPEQEALVGCGPYFGTACFSNGIDLLWAEGSAAVQSFVGSDSLGIAFADMGIADLVAAEYGTHLMDNGSPSQEYRTDGRVIGKNGRLIRINDDTLQPELGSEGFLNGVGVGNINKNVPGSTRGDCDITNGPIVRAGGPQDGTVDFFNDRTSARCWDLRRFFTAYGVQPGTAAFEILGLGGPKCTTADIGGPLDPRKSVLPGCRNKWATIQYQPLNSWDPATGLHPNNPDAGYIGNNWYGQSFSYKTAAALDRPTAFDPNVLPQPRTDYRQWSSNPQNHVRRDIINRNLPGANGTELAAEFAGGPTGIVPCGVNDNLFNPGAADGPESYDCYVRNPSYRPAANDGLQQWRTLYAIPGLDPNCDRADPRCIEGPDGPDDVDLQDMLPASIRLSSSWATGGADPRYELAKLSRRSGLNWGVFDPILARCNTSRTLERQQDDPDCYVGGWRQGVDGDPDRVGTGVDPTGSFGYPSFQRAFGNNLDVFAGANYGDRVEGDGLGNGCTNGLASIYLNRLADGRLIDRANCANVFQNANLQLDGSRWPDDLLFGAGHPFTGESFANEMAGVSFNLMMLLVTFSEEFTDGLASVRGFVNPELYESRFIYDEEWMWNVECIVGGPKPIDECGGRNFVLGVPLDPSIDQFHSAYGDPNLDPATLMPYADGRIRQAFDPNLTGNARLNSRVGWQSTGLGNLAGANADGRRQRVPNPLPVGVTNKLQRDPSLPNIMTTFPDLLFQECTSARNNTDPTRTLRQLWEACGTTANGGVNDWTRRANGTFWQDLRLGNSAGQGSPVQPALIESMLFDFAFTGTENDLMAMIPYCENLEFTQRHVDGLGDTGAQGAGQARYGPTRIDCTRGEQGEVLGRERCTYVTPQYCELVQALFGLAGQKRPILSAAGNGQFGRRTMQWHSGNEIFLDYEKRNVLGFSLDFAEDYTKSNWSMEFTWIQGIPQIDNLSYNLTSDVDDFNLTVSVDRPTFINFLNANRTFFINSQWFFQYRNGWRDSFTTPGPWNVLATFAVFTGYFQDRLNPTLVFVWDFRSASGGALPQVNYRFSENFSITVGASLFTGSQRLIDMPLNPIAPAGPRAGPNAYQDGTEPGLSLVRDRDEVFMTLRYTF